MAELNRSRDILVSAALKETAYGTAQTVDSLIAAALATMPNPTPTIINDSDRLSASEEPTDQEIIATANEMTLAQPRVKPHTLAFLATYGLGAISSALADSGTSAAATYKHTITPVVALALPSFTMEALMKVGLRKEYPGCGVGSINLSGTRGANRALDVSADLIVSGNDTTGAGSATEKAEAAINAGPTTGVYLGAVAYSGSTDEVCDPATTDLAATPATLTTLVESFEWQFDNQIDAEGLYQFGSGLYYGTMERTGRLQKVVLNFDYTDETEVDRLIAQTQVSFQWKTRGALAETGYYYGMNLIFPALKYESVQRVETRGKIVNAVTMQVLQDATYGSVILDIFNKQAAYAA